MTKTFLPQNEFISGSASVPFAKPEATSLIAPHEVVTLSDDDGISALPSGECEPSVMLAYPSSEAATVSGRAPVAATLSHNKITQAVEIQSSRGDGKVASMKCSATGVDPTDTFCSAEPEVAPGPRDSNPALPVSSEPSLPAVAPTVAAGFLENDLEQLIGVAGKRRRRPLALPRFAPDFPELWKAMHDKSAPRAVLDPLWADASPLFLQDVR